MMVKLLLMGSGNINPINIFTGLLMKDATHKFSIDGLNLFKKGANNVDKDYENITNNFRIEKDTKLENISSSDRRKYAFEDYSLWSFFKMLLKTKFIPVRVKNILNAKVVEKDYRSRMLEKIGAYDIVHVHFLEEWQCEIIPLIPDSVRVVITFWGSDLLNRAGKWLYGLQYDALQRADAITVIGSEMQEILLAKFGRELKAKVHFAIIGKDPELTRQIIIKEPQMLRAGNELIKQMGKDPKQFPYVVKLGYNAFPAQNHIAILRQMGKLPKDIINKTLFIIPMTYGYFSEDYIPSIKAEVEKHSLHAVYLENYLSDLEAKSLSVITNIMFNLRDTDALNGSMTDSLLAGAVVFNGAWLPYKILKEQGVWFVDVYRIENLSIQFEEVIIDFETVTNKMRNNPGILKGFFYGAQNICAWEKAYGL